MSFEPMASNGLYDAEEHRSAARRHLREVYLQAKLDYLRLQQGYQSKDDATTLKLAKVMGELRDLYGAEPPNRARRRERLQNRETSYVGGQIPASERAIPDYNAVRDRHCTYVGSKNFKNSPFMRLKLAADKAVRYFGGGGGRAPTSEENMLKSNLLFLSPLGKSNLPPPTAASKAAKQATSPLRKKLNANIVPSEPLGSTITPMALLLGDAAGPRPLAPTDVKRSRHRGLGPSPPGRKRNKLEHEAAEDAAAGGLLRGPSAEGGGGLLPDTPPLDLQLRTPPHSQTGSRRMSPDGARQLIRPPSGTNPSDSGGALIPRRSVCSPLPGSRGNLSSRASDARGGSSHGGSSAGSVKGWMIDMEGMSEGLALLEKLRQEVMGIKHELVVRGLIPPSSTSSNTAELEDAMERPPTVPDDTWLQRAFNREPSPPMPPGAARVFTQVLLLQDRLRVQGYPYATQLSVWLTELGALEVRVRNMDRALDLVPFTVHPIFVNKITGWTPEMFAGVEGEAEARRKKLEPILDQLRMADDGRTLSLMVDPFIYEGVHPLGNSHFRVRVLRLTAGNGLVVMAEPTGLEAQSGRLKLVVYDSELEVLLCHQPGLYRRANTQWSTQQLIAEWLVARLSVVTDDSYEGPDGGRVSTSHLVLDRSIRLPADKSWTTATSTTGGGQEAAPCKYVLSAWQEDAAIAIECRRVVGGEEGGGEATSKERVEWVEVQAFIGSTMLHSASAELLNAEEDPLPQTPLEYLLARLTVGGDGVLHVDRVMYKEVRNVSGCTVLLHGAILGADLVYRAQRVKVPGHGGADEGQAAASEVLTRGITEKEAVKLMLKEPAEVRKVLFAYLNRALLCRALTDMLRVVEDRGSLRLETALYVPSDLLKIAVRHKGGGDGKEEEQPVMLGSVLVHSHTTLAQVRRLIKEKLDPESLPPLFSFETHGVPCSTKQESEWLAKDLLPLLFLVPRHGTALFNEFRAAHAKAAAKNATSPKHGKQRRPRTTGTDMSDEMGSGNQQDSDEDDDDDDMSEDNLPSRRRRKALMATKRSSKNKARKAKQRENRRSVADLLNALEEGGGTGGGEGEAEAKEEGEEGDEREESTVLDEEPIDDEDNNRRTTRRSKKAQQAGKKDAGKGASETVAVPLMARVSILEGDRVVKCSEDLRHVIRQGCLVRLEFPTGPEYKVSGHPDDPYGPEAFTLDKPWIRYVPGQEAAVDKPPPIPIKTPAEIAREKHEAAAKARLQEGSQLVSTATQGVKADPGSKSLEQLTREVVQEEEMQQPIFFKTGSTPTAADMPPSGEAEDPPAASPKQAEETEEKGEGKLPAEAKAEGEGEHGGASPKATVGTGGQAEGGGAAAAAQPAPAEAKPSSASSETAASKGFVSYMFGGTLSVSPATPPPRVSTGTLSPKSIIKAFSPTKQHAAPTGAGQLSSSSAVAVPQGGVMGPVEYRNLIVYKVVPKAEDLRPQWRVEFDAEKVPYKFDHKKSHATMEVLHVRLRLSRLESLCKDVFTTYTPLHTQRVDYFDKTPVETLVRALHTKLTAGRLLGDALPVNTWQGFVEELDLLPRHVKFLVSPAKLNELMDPVSAVPEDRRTGSAGRMGAGLMAVQMGTSPFKPAGADKSRTRQNPLGTSMASMMMMEEAMAPRWSDYLDASGKIDFQGFLCLLKELAGLHYPRLRLDPEMALRTLALEKLIFRIPDLHALAWSEAKRLAMEVEGTRQAVAMRLQAFQRRKVAYRWYRGIRSKCIRIQACWRRAILHYHYQLRLTYFEEDRCIRIRHVSALRIQTAYRVFRARRTYLRLIEVREAANRERLAARRARQHEKRRIRQMATLYRSSRIFGGTCTLIQILKRDGRRSSKNCDMIIRCYIPITQETIDFDLPEAQVRGFIERFINRAGLSVQELTDPENVQCLANRLLVKKVGDKYSVVFSRRSASERGVKVQRRAARVSGCNMVVTVYRTSDEYAFRAYDLTTCEDLRVAVTTKTLRKWLQDEERKDMFAAIVVKRRKLKDALKTLQLATRPGATVSPERVEEAQSFLRSVGGKEAHEASLMEEEKMVAHNFEPILLQPRHQPALLRWMVDRITLYKRKGDHQRVLVLAYEIDRLLKDTSAAKIQGLYRMLKAKHAVRAAIREQFEKQMDWASKRMVYVKKATDARSTRKPPLLGPEDLDPPKDEYRPMKDMQGKRYYFNPATGQVSRMSPMEAARVMQRAVRRRLDQEIGRPCMQDIVKAMLMISQAPAKYHEFPDRLTTCLNYAMVLHTQTFEWDEAREVYQKTLKKGGENPVVMRCYAVFLLASCDEPRQVNFQRANELLKLAEVMDPGHERFKTALECFFKWSLVLNPQSQHALLNFALVMQGVVGDHDKAEAYYRRALTLSPYDPKVLQNFDDYLRERLPGGAYGSTGPSQFVVRRSEVIEMKELEWGEWVRMRDTKAVKPEFEKYWYDKLTLKTSWERPNFSEHVKARLKRSKVVRNLGEWKQYKDPMFKGGFTFWCHSLSYMLRLDDPFA